MLNFIRESNLIEGITREPTSAEIAAHEELLLKYKMTVAVLNAFQEVVAPGKPLRIREHMNVRVGNHIAPEGGLEIAEQLKIICDRANRGHNTWKIHIAFENLHPYLDGNGRTGRALWAWQTQHKGLDPFALPFLHRFYYQTLENNQQEEK